MPVKHPVVRSRSRVRSSVVALALLGLMTASLSLGNARPANAFSGDCVPGSNWGTLDTSFAAQVLSLVNAHRAAMGLGALKSSPTLTAAANWKSLHMAYYGYLAHDDPAPPVARVWYDRVGACGYPIGQVAAGENIASGYSTPQSVMDAWLDSPAHKGNIEASYYGAVGISAARAADGTWYWTQDFGSYVDPGSTDGGPTPPAVNLTGNPDPLTTSTTAVLWFTTSNSPTSVVCSLDGAPATSCSSPTTYPGLALGTHTFKISVSNTAGSNSASYSWQITPTVIKPTATIISGPPVSTTSTSAAFSFTTANSPTLVTCSVDGSADLPCTSPKNYMAMTLGGHVFTVTVSNLNGSNSASYGWTVTSTISAPTATLTSFPAASTTSSSATFGWTTTGSPTSTSCTLDGTAASCSSPSSYNGLAVGSHTFAVAVSNSAGSNTTSYSWTINPTVSAPTVSLTSSPGSSTPSTSASFGWTTTNSPTSTSCSLDGTAAACSSPTGYSGLDVGRHTFTVTVSNSAGSNSASYSWTINASVVAPTVTLQTFPPGPTASTTASFSWTTSNSPTDTSCSLDGRAPTACSSPAGYSGLDGGHHFFVVTVSNSGGSNSASYNWTINQVVDVPTVTLASAPAASTTSTDASFGWTTANSPTSTVCSLDGATAAACSSSTGYSNLGVGNHSFTVTVSNSAGSNSASYGWTIKPVVVAPTVTLTSAPAASTTSTAAAFGWTTTGAATSTLCAFDGGAAFDCSSPMGFPNVPVGDHAFVVTVSNSAGSNSASYNWTIKPVVVAPTVTLTSAPAASTTSTDASFGWTTANSPTSTVCSLDGATAAACSSSTGYSNLGVGNHSFTVTVSNSAGSNSASYGWTIKPVVVAPTVTLTSAPAASTTSTDASFGWTTANSPTSTVCSLDGATAAACSSSTGYSNLGVGNHSFTVTVSNSAGSNSASYGWTVNPVATGGPTVTLTSFPGAVATSASATFAWTTTGTVTRTTCSFDGAAAFDCALPVAFIGLPIGDHRFVVTVYSSDGGSGSAAYTWTVLKVPKVTLTPFFVGVGQVRFSWRTYNAPTSVVCSLDGAPATPCNSGITYTVDNAPHTLVVTASNAAGSGSAQYSW